MEPVQLDGSEGEGGGQILRTALTLSMVTGRPFRMRRIRAKRSKPGLMRQHLTAVQASAAVCGARVEGDAVGSMDLVFTPGPLVPGDYRFSVGTAGSTVLVFQTLFPALVTAGKPFSLALEGGTHNPNAPSVDFLEKTYLPCLRAMGVETEIALERRGFYPAGGGRWTARVTPPASLGPLSLLERGAFWSLEARVVWARVPASVPEKEVRALRARLVLEEAVVSQEEDRSTPGPGNVILIEIRHENVAEVVSAYGERGKAAETVAEEAAREAGEYRDGGMPVGPHLADQLLVPMALPGSGGGAYRTLPLTLHSRTNIETIRKFLDRAIEVVALKDRAVEVRVQPP